MDTNAVKDKIVTNVYYISPEKKVPLHKHEEHDEIFYCVQGEGYGVFECEEKELSIGKEFIVPAGKLHSLRSDSDLFVTSFLIPLIKEKIEKPREEKREEKNEGSMCQNGQKQGEEEDESKDKEKDSKDRSREDKKEKKD
jgi:quercetin dioxygenase-like cupin family protein